MSLKYLGVTLDIHGGGQDLIFPHHENEIAQSEAFTGTSPFSQLWIHHGLLQLGNEKMSKSLGNLITIKEVLSKHNPDALRLFVLSSYYRSPLTYSEDTIYAMERGLERLCHAIEDEGPVNKDARILDANPFKEKFIDSLEDDLNTAQAVAVLYDLAREINKSKSDSINTTSATLILKELASVLGLRLVGSDKDKDLDVTVYRTLMDSLQEAIKNAGQVNVADRMYHSISQRSDLDQIIGALLDARNELRETKQLELSDQIRSGLSNLGVVLEDTAHGTVWKVRPNTQNG